MTIYLKDGSVENCLSDEHKSEFWEDLIERRLGRDALTFYQNDIQTEAKEALEEQLSDLQLKLVHASEHLEESLWQIGTAKSMSRKHITNLLNEANRLLTEISQQIDKVKYDLFLASKANDTEQMDRIIARRDAVMELTA